MAHSIQNKSPRLSDHVHPLPSDPPTHPQPNSFKHFCFYIFEFDLVQNAELEAIETLVARMRQEYQAQGSQRAGAGVGVSAGASSQVQPPSIGTDGGAVAAASAP